MDEKEIIDLIKNDSTFKTDDRLWKNTKKRINMKENITSEYEDKRRILIFRIIAFSCIAVILLLVFFLLNLNNPTVQNPNESTPAGSDQIQSPPVSASHGPVIPVYHRYDGKYYMLQRPTNNSDDQVTKDFIYIQDKIIGRLGTYYYEISGMDPSKSITLFDGRYYYKLDYAFQDSVTFNGKPYLIGPNEGPGCTVDPNTRKVVFEVGDYLGKAGDYDAYVFPDYAPSERIAIKLNSNAESYCTAYQLMSSVTLNNAVYEVQPGIIDIPEGEKARYLGKAGPYDAYAIEGRPEAIILHIDDSKETTANAMAAPSDGTIPKSSYGSVFDRMYSLSARILWDHKIYEVSSTFDYIGRQDELRNLIGSQLGGIIGSYGKTFFLYEIKGIDRSKSIAFLDNEVYVKYDYLLDTIVKFNGKDYEISLTGGSYGKRGGQIGTSDSHEVYEIEGVDPSEEIIVLIKGTTWNARSIR